jgi:hypothetical protein
VPPLSQHPTTSTRPCSSRQIPVTASEKILVTPIRLLFQSSAASLRTCPSSPATIRWYHEIERSYPQAAPAGGKFTLPGLPGHKEKLRKLALFVQKTHSREETDGAGFWVQGFWRTHCKREIGLPAPSTNTITSFLRQGLARYFLRLLRAETLQLFAQLRS